MLYWGTDCISLSLRWWREKITHDRQTDMLESKISFNESVLALDLALPVVPRLALHQHSYLGKLAKLIFGKSWYFSVIFLEIFGKKRVKYAIKTVICKSWDWVRPPPSLGQIPNFYRNFFL